MARAPRPVLVTGDGAGGGGGGLTDAQLRATAVPVSSATLASASKQDALLAVLPDDYEAVAASQATQVIGATGAVGDYLAGLLVVPATTAPGAIAIKDGANGAITVFTGGAASVGNLVPFFLPVQAKSKVGAWQVTTGANVSVLAIGNFT